MSMKAGQSDQSFAKLTSEIRLLRKQNAALRRENSSLFARCNAHIRRTESQFERDVLIRLEEIDKLLIQQLSKGNRLSRLFLPFPTRLFRKVTSVIKRFTLRKEHAALRDSGLFSNEYYLSNNPDIAESRQDPLLHFLFHGAREKRNPCQYFDVEYYLDTYPDVKASGINPLAHYILRGEDEGRRPNPFFDPRYYSQQISRPEMEGLGPLEHYFKRGWLQQLNPSAEFDVKFYLGKYPDVKFNSLEPLAHFLKNGRSEGRLSCPSYQEWLRCYFTLGQEDILLVKRHIESFYFRPAFVLVLYVYPEYLKDIKIFASSIKKQLFPFSEVWLGGSPTTIDSLREVKELEDMSVGSLCFVSALPFEFFERCREGIKADYIFFSKAIPFLFPQAAYYVADVVQRNRQVSFLYCDEDVTGSLQERKRPFFKPDFDRDLVLTMDYLSNFCVIDSAHLQGASALEGDTWPALLRELVLQMINGLDGSSVYHLAEVLVSFSEDEVSLGLAEEVAVVSKELAVSSVSAAVEVTGENRIRIVREIGAEPPLVSIIIPTKNQWQLLANCLEGISNGTDYPKIEVVVVDNESSEEEALKLLTSLSEKPHYKVVPFCHDFNFSKMINLGVEASCGEILVLLNNDIEIIDRFWLRELVSQAIRQEIGCVGAKLLYPDGAIQHAGIVLGHNGLASLAFNGVKDNSGGYMNFADTVRQVSAVTAACLAVRRDIFDQVGGFDEDLPVAFNDVDFCLRVDACGLRNLYTPWVRLIHHESASRGADHESLEKTQRCAVEEARVKARWADRIYCDPYYNPNLAFDTELYSLAYPPRISKPWVAEQGFSEFKALDRVEQLNVYYGDSNYRRVLDSMQPLSVGKIDYKLPGVSVIILTKDKPEYIIPLVEGLIEQIEIFKAEGLPFEVLVGDTGSTDSKVMEFYQDKQKLVRLFSGLNYHFSRCNNWVARQAVHDTLLFLNNDIVIPSGSQALLSLRKLLWSDNKIGCVGPVLWFPDGTVQHMGIDFVSEGDMWGMPKHVCHHEMLEEVSISERTIYPAVTGAFLMTRRALFDKLGGFDERYRRECQDVAYCIDLYRLGYHNVCVNCDHIIHVENATRPKGEEDLIDRRRFLRLYGAYIEAAFL